MLARRATAAALAVALVPTTGGAEDTGGSRADSARRWTAYLNDLKARPPLAREHDCYLMHAPGGVTSVFVEPQTGFLLRDTAGKDPHKLFYRDSDSLTPALSGHQYGLLVGYGGTWAIEYQCRR